MMTTKHYEWSPYAEVYDSLKCGSIDGTDLEPHDRAVKRAQLASYKPSSHLNSEPDHTIFVTRLNRDTNEETLQTFFKRYGVIKQLTLVCNIVTGFSQGYCFVEFELRSDAEAAWRGAHQAQLNGREIIVEMEMARKLPGWIPRRMGGGFGGRKESGQLRFGCRERPFRKPINIDTDRHRHTEENNEKSRYVSRDRDLERRRRSPGRVRYRETARSRERSRRRSRSRSRDRKTRRRSRSSERSRRRSRSR